MVWQAATKLLGSIALTALIGTASVTLPAPTAQAATLQMAWSQDATGLDPQRLAENAEWIGQQLGIEVPGQLSRAGRFPQPAAAV